MSNNNYEKLSREELIEIIARMVKESESGEKEQEVVNGEGTESGAKVDGTDDLERLDNEYLSPYTEDERNGDYEGYTAEELAGAVADVMDSSESGETPKTEEEEALREMSIAEQEKLLKDIQRNKRKVDNAIRVGFFKKMKDNAIAGIQAAGDTISDKAKKYGKDYAAAKQKKDSIEEEFKIAIEDLANKWTQIQESIEKEIESLEKLESSQTMRISGYVNGKNKLINKKMEIDAKAKEQLGKAWDEKDEVTLFKAVLDVIRYKEKLERFEKAINRENKKLDAIRTQLEETRDMKYSKENEYNRIIQELELDRDNKLEAIPQQNIFQKAIGKIVNMFTAKKSKKTISKEQQEKLDRIKAEYERVKEDFEDYEEAREGREEERDKEYYGINVDDVYNESIKDKYKRRKQSGEEKREAKAAAREELRKQKMEQEKEKMAQRILKAQEKLNKQQEKLNKQQGKLSGNPAIEGR